MSRTAATSLAFIGLLWSAAPASAHECFFDESVETAPIALADGTLVRRYATHLRVGDRVVSPCNGLPAEHPTAITPYGDTFAVGFRAGGAHIYVNGSFDALPDPLPRNVRALAAMDARLFVGTTAGLFEFAGGSVRPLGRGRMRRVITALATQDDTLHVGLDPIGWWRRSGDGPFQVVRRGDPVGCFRVGTRVQALPPGPECTAPAGRSSHFSAVVQHQGALLFATFDRGLVAHDGRGGFVPVAGSPHFINTLLSDGDTLWIGTARGLYAMRGGRFSRRHAGLPSQHVNGLWRSPDGELWIATGAGLVALDQGRSRLFDHRNGLPSRIVYAVVGTADGAVWAGTAEGAVRISDEGLRSYRQENGTLPGNWVTALLPEGDAVLVGTYDSGVARLTPDGAMEVLAGLERLWVNPHGVQRRGPDLYISTLGDGLWLLRGPDARPIESLPSLDVTGVAVANGGLWVATRGGLARVADTGP